MTQRGWYTQAPAPCLGSGQLSTTVYTPEYLCEFRLKVPLWVLGLDGLPAPLPPAAPAALMVSPKAFPYKSLALDAQIQVCIWVLSIKILNLKYHRSNVSISSLIWWKMHLSLLVRLFNSLFWGFIFAIQIVTPFYTLHFINSLSINS